MNIRRTEYRIWISRDSWVRAVPFLRGSIPAGEKPGKDPGRAKRRAVMAEGMSVVQFRYRDTFWGGRKLEQRTVPSLLKMGESRKNRR